MEISQHNSSAKETKKGNKDHFENYRPISLLSIKSLERSILKQIHSRYIMYSSVIIDFTHYREGLRQRRFTNWRCFYECCYKAFDIVDHTKLLQKLQDFCFSGSVLLWFKNDLSKRFQRVTALGATSKYCICLLPLKFHKDHYWVSFIFCLYTSMAHLSIGVYLLRSASLPRTPNCIDVCRILVIQSLHCWSGKNRFGFSQSKCKVLCINWTKTALLHGYFKNPWRHPSLVPAIHPINCEYRKSTEKSNKKQQDYFDLTFYP